MGQDFDQLYRQGGAEVKPQPETQEEAQKQAAERVFVTLVETIAKGVAEEVLAKSQNFSEDLSERIARAVDDTLDNIDFIDADSVQDVLSNYFDTWNEGYNTVQAIVEDVVSDTLRNEGYDSRLDDLDSDVYDVKERVEQLENSDVSELLDRIQEIENRLDSAEIRI